MSLSTESVKVVILVDEYTVSGDVNSDTTRRVADYVGRKMTQIQAGSSREKLKTAVLSAMNIAGELFESRGRHDETEKAVSEINQKAAAISTRIDAALAVVD